MALDRNQTNLVHFRRRQTRTFDPPQELIDCANMRVWAKELPVNRQIRYRIVFMVMSFLWVTGVQNAPVPLLSPNRQPILVRTKAIYEGNFTKTLPIRENPLTTSFSEMMSLPTGQLTTTYLFPWYNNVDINTELKIGNVGTSSTTVTVTIAGTVRGSYDLIPNQTTQIS